MSKQHPVLLSVALGEFFQHFAGHGGQEMHLNKEDVVGFAAALAEMAGYARELEMVAPRRPTLGRSALAASAVAFSGNVIVFPIVPRPVPAS